MGFQGGACLSSQLFREAQIGRSWIRVAPVIKQEPISKITNTKRAGRVTGVAGHLPSKHEAKFNPQYCQKKKT
jgi:hypothetical protein